MAAERAPTSSPDSGRSGFGRIFRTTAVKLAAIYLVVFTAFSGFLIAYLAFNTGEILSRGLRAAIEQDMGNLRDQYAIGGLSRLVRAVEARVRRPGAGVYLVVDLSGSPIAGNIAEIPAFVIDTPGGRLLPVRYQRLDRDDDHPYRALVRVAVLENGFRLVVGRDVGERDEFREMIRDALRAALLVMIGLGLVTWWFVNRRVLKRIDQVSATSAQIVGGDLTRRLPLAGTGDEFDRLATSLNTMLGRMDELMRGLKEVSDNIAHDLKTPLTRLRNRVESTLAGEPSIERYREALEATIAESDGLIQTFNALLLIARVEAGSATAALTQTDLSTTVSDAVELYEPVAEEAGATLTATIEPGLVARASRELIAQALTNLIDNALKYGRPDPSTPFVVTVSVRRDAGGVRIDVADNGPGIPPADRERVFGRFVRLEASRNAPGSGLGLALVHAVAHLHGGSVELGDAGPGLRVTMRWPG